MCEVVSKNIALKRTIVFQKNPLFSNMCTFFIPLFWNENNITGSMFKFVNAEMAKRKTASEASAQKF